jgi:hypothetical protein
MNPSPELIAALTKLLKSSPTNWRVIEGGYTLAQRWVVALENNTSVFVKSATNQRTAEWLEAEWKVYQTVQAAFMPNNLGFGNANGYPFLVLEDLSHATWPPPWKDTDIALVQKTLLTLHATPVPAHLKNLEDQRSELGGWLLVQENPDPFLSLGFCSSDWYSTHINSLVEAEKKAVLAGDDLVHSDIRSDNLCLVGESVKIIDWNYACRGNGAFDTVGWLPSLYLEGGPAPWEILINEPELIALMAGYFAHFSPQPHVSTPRHREFQKAQLRIALQWACRALNLPIPEELVS